MFAVANPKIGPFGSGAVAGTAVGSTIGTLALGSGGFSVESQTLPARPAELGYGWGRGQFCGHLQDGADLGLILVFADGVAELFAPIDRPTHRAAHVSMAGAILPKISGLAS